MTLMLHAGANAVSYDDLRAVPIPAPTDTHIPVAHHEIVEHGKSPESQRKAQGDLRNEGRVEDGKAPKTTKPGTGHPKK